MADAAGVTKAIDLFHQYFGSDAKPTHAAAAPGRVNLIGEHTDYNDGFVFPIALQKSTYVVGRAIEGKDCRVACERYDPMAEFSVDVSERGKETWVNYVSGMVAVYRKHGYKLGGFECAIYSDVPMGGGVSSSAALEMSIGTFLEALFGLDVDPTLRAEMGQQCEHEFVGVKCGIMDQLISSKGVAGNALLIDCRNRHCTLVPLNMPDVVIVVADSNVKHKLADSEYSTRREQCEAAVEIIKRKYPQVNKLRDVTEDMLAAMEEELTAENEKIFHRARHVVRENKRTEDAKDAFMKADLKRFGKLMNESHESLRQDYEVSTDEIDALVGIALSVSGVYGSRITGGGFGGCTVTLVQKDKVPALLNAIREKYPAKAEGKHAKCFETLAGPGARQLQLP